MTARTTAPIETDEHDFLTLAQVAAPLGKSERTIWRWIELGKLKGIRVGGRWFVRKQELERYQSQRRK